jgi:hypothetical protein
MPSIGDLDKQMEMLPYIQIVAGVCGLIAVLAVLGGISAVGRALGDDGLGSRARGLMIGRGSARFKNGTSNWLNATIAALVTSRSGSRAARMCSMSSMFGYLGTLKTASDAMRSGSRLPEARVVEPSDKP